MSATQAETSNRCAPIGWRPLRHDDATRKLAAEVVAHDLAGWLEFATGTSWEIDRIGALLLDCAPKGEEADGYALARTFEKFGLRPDSGLVDILDGWADALDAATRRREMEEAGRRGIEAPFGTSAAARLFREDGSEQIGTAFRIPEDRLGRCAFVPGEVALDPTGDVCVLSVGLEDVEILGPAPRSADSLHVVALAAVDAHDGQYLLEQLSRQADLDIGMFNEDVVASTTVRQADGTSALTAHLELAGGLLEKAVSAMEGDDQKRVWVAALMCAAAARRIAMLAGSVPDPDETSDMVAELSDVAADDDLGSLAPDAAMPSVLLH
jgi:hypothetical protein